MDIKTAAKEIKQGKIRPLYVLYGTEKYRMNEFVQYIMQAAVPEEHRDLAVTKMDTAEMPIDAVVEEADTLPFLVDRKLILVKDQTIFASGKEGKIEHRTDRLLAYMDSPNETSILIFLVQADKLDERKKLVKVAKTADAVIAFQPFSAEELMSWVRKQAEKLGTKIEEQAVEALLNSAGTQLQSLSAELEKLSMYTGKGGTITAETVSQLITKNTEQNVFQLVEDVISKRTDRAVSTLYELLKQREEPIKIVALIIRQLRIMLQVKELTGQSFSQQQTASQLGLHPYAVKLAAEQARTHQASELAGWLAEAAELDYEMKTGRVDKAFGLEMFIMRIAASTPRQAHKETRR